MRTEIPSYQLMGNGFMPLVLTLPGRPWRLDGLGQRALPAQDVTLGAEAGVSILRHMLGTQPSLRVLLTLVSQCLVIGQEWV